MIEPRNPGCSWGRPLADMGASSDSPQRPGEAPRPGSKSRAYVRGNPQEPGRPPVTPLKSGNAERGKTERGVMVQGESDGPVRPKKSGNRPQREPAEERGPRARRTEEETDV